MIGWKLHEGNLGPDDIVAPDERLSWGKTAGLGAQHVVAMFGATFLVPILTGFSPATTMFFSGFGTILFLLITRNKLPSYLGSSFAFIAPITAAMASGGESVALGGVVMTGVLLALIGLLVHFAGARWIDVVMPPIVTGTIVALIGFNLAPTAWANVKLAPVTALITLGAIILGSVAFRGMLGRLSILVGVVIGYAVAMLRGEVDFEKFNAAAWVGLPDFVTPSFDASVLGLFLPVVFVLIAENVVTVGKAPAAAWPGLKAAVGAAIRTQLLSGVPSMRGAPGATGLPVRSDAELGAAVQELLDREVNRAVANHGGKISLLAVRDRRLFITMSGGCQGCASSQVTLRQGFEVMVRRVAPEITEVVDATDHAAGRQPFYLPAATVDV